MSVKRTPHLLLVLLVILFGIVRVGRGQSDKASAASSNSQSHVSPLTTAPAGAERCVNCHRSEVEGYSQYAMAHSLRRAGDEPDGVVKTPDTTITMHSSPTGYWQSLQSGGETSRYRIDYVIGSGNHAAGYLLDVDGHLFQSPVAYYTSRRAYDLAPGFEGRPNPDFTRPVVEECVFCHSGDPLHIAGTTNQYRSPPFAAEAITCERCHGPAEKHLFDPRAGTIINPAKLSPAARDSVCEQCHLLGVARVLNPGKTFSDFQPGEPLENVFTTYVNAVPPGSDAGKLKVISHVEQLARSTCARESNGRMWCGTCHDPHNKPLDPVAYYRNKCLSCHAEKFSASHPSRNSNCISCHMPRRNAKDGGHTAFTDHRIQRRPESQPDLPADLDIAAWREPAPQLEKRNLGIAYIDVGTNRRSAPFIGHGYRLLTEVQNQFSKDSDVFMSMGNALLLAKQTSEAEFAFERVLQLEPDSVIGETKAASASLQAGDANTAIARLERAVALDPLHLPAIVTLVNLYKQQGNGEKAEELSARVTATMDKQAAPDETAGTSSPSPLQMAAVAYKNVQVLKDIPSDQLLPSMRFISASLGVQCSYCHVENHFESDAKKPKQSAREMMRMMLAIDKNIFKGNREVTCYSCHRGSLRPESAPMVAGEPPRNAPLGQATTSNAEKLLSSLPTASELIDNYVQALGGTSAIEKINSLEEKGTTTLAGKPVSVEVFDRNPDKRNWTLHLPQGDRVAILNGHEGWLRVPGQPVSEMQGERLDALEMAADLHFPLHIKQVFDELQVEYPEKIGDRDAYVILAKRHGREPVKLYFDEHTGLLVRSVRYADSPLGAFPLQIDYDDYRDMDGVKFPFHWRIARAEGTLNIQLQQIQENVPINSARFSKATTSGPKQKPST
jgi:photosynthetic reaction center cytochrome c subunit